MMHKEFHDRLMGQLTERQIDAIQKIAFSNYEDAHGCRPRSKEEKMLAYDFMIDYLRDMDANECVRYLKPFGIPSDIAIRLWEELD